ncbi:hypothetical protein SY88_10545 [Clostridiales bacterium PH28_bin88]|nr:hypothetical protein SY88_10545 [Clostridiales bacterium PH28_bin88]
MPLFVQNQQDKVPVPDGFEGLLARLTELALQQEKVGQEAEIGITLVDDSEIHRLNKDYRGVDSPTDVLSFALRDESQEEPVIAGAEEDHLLGDVVISMETALRQSCEYGHSLEREVGFLAVHGMLHLLGYDHPTEEERERMYLREEAVLNAAGLTR